MRRTVAPSATDTQLGTLLGTLLLALTAPTAAAADVDADVAIDGAVDIGPTLSLDPELPQSGGLAIPAGQAIRAAAATAATTATAWRFGVTGFVRAPLRMSWGPPTTLRAAGAGDPGTQLRTPPLVPDADPNDWRYTNNLAAPWTELNLHFGNGRVAAMVQVASLNITDAGYRNLAGNLGINQSFLSIEFPDVINQHGRLILIAGGFTNRYGAAGRFDAAKYDTYLFGRTHTAGETLRFQYHLGASTLLLEHGFGAKLEPLPFYPNVPRSNSRPWDPYPGPVAQESTFVHHAHAGVVLGRSLLIGLHYLDVFANDNQRAGAFVLTDTTDQRAASAARPRIVITGGELKLLGTTFGDGYLGYAHLVAVNADYLGDAIDVLHSRTGWQLHDNFFGVPGVAERATGTIDSLLFQHELSVARLLGHAASDAGDGPDLIVSVFAMFNRVSGARDPNFPNFNHDRLKAGGEVTYLPLPWLGLGARFDTIQPNLHDTTKGFAVFSPRVVLRTAFLTHEQIVFQYARYSYGAGAATSQYPYNNPPNADGTPALNLGTDKNAAQVAAIIWF